MYSSPVFKTSPHCIASPDGALLAIAQPARLVVRDTRTLQVVHEIALAADVSAALFHVAWAPSSARLLVAAADKLLVFSARDATFKATVKNPASSSARPTHVQFGPTDAEVVVFSHFGLKLALVNLAAAAAVEVTNPKFHQPPATARCLSFRPGSNHLALLTRTNGKDSVSIHVPGSRAVERAFHPDTVDAQGVVWASKGRWLVVWESAAHGHKVLMYTPDGHLFNTWTGPPDTGAEAQHFDLGAGVKHFHMDRLGMKAVICDYTSALTIMDLSVGSQIMRLAHPATVIPTDTLQVWQEQQPPADSPSTSVFLRATQPFFPPERTTTTTTTITTAGPAQSCFLAEFDCASGLLATVTEAHRSTLWIWDLNSADLRSVLVFHSAISAIAWHPQIPELLLITCVPDASTTNAPTTSTTAAAVYTWDPLSKGPHTVPQPPPTKPTKPPVPAPKTRAAWVPAHTDPPLILLNDGTSGTLVAAINDADTDADAPAAAAALWGGVDTQLSAKVLHGAAAAAWPKVLDPGDMSFAEDDGTVRVDDTFDFKKQKQKM
ncbi:hypothetical protein BROUX41_004107 [Berkeleyomyces rouxiae]|uniref:uncharacterized protein n=1 Tax=Berkeleyomyces rouxiae TaxID=2035830 RepID=UPI003B760916